MVWATSVWNVPVPSSKTLHTLQLKKKKKKCGTEHLPSQCWPWSKLRSYNLSEKCWVHDVFVLILRAFSFTLTHSSQWKRWWNKQREQEGGTWWWANVVKPSSTMFGFSLRDTTGAPCTGQERSSVHRFALVSFHADHSTILLTF